MKFRILVAYQDEKQDEEPWWEEYDKNISNPRKWAMDEIEMFNNTLACHERPRVLMKMEVLDENSRKEHAWEKQNLVTVMSRGEVYDVLKCNVCGVTGKRHGLSNSIELDRKYKAAVYARCDTALRHLKKKRNRK